MREIKFRAFDQDMMVYQDTSPIMGGLDAGDMLQRFEQSNIMQYTGLKDRNGTEIYEGDFVYFYICSDDEHYIGHVSFDSDDYTAGYVIVYDNGNLWDVFEDCEVVGNIYENPELIE